MVAVSLFAGAAVNNSGKEMKFKPVPVNMDSIKRDIENPYSNYYYKKLWNKFLSNDTNMSMHEYRHLYLGYIYQEDYNPYRQSEFSTKIEPLYYKKKHTSDECDTIMKYAELSLRDDPFDLNQMQFYIYVLRERQKYARASIWQFRLNHLIQAILSTGNGTQESPWIVTSPTHEYSIVNFMGLIATDHKEFEGDIDYIIVDKSGGKKGPDGYYFDVSNILEMYKLKYGE